MRQPDHYANLAERALAEVPETLGAEGKHRRLMAAQVYATLAVAACYVPGTLETIMEEGQIAHDQHD